MFMPMIQSRLIMKILERNDQYFDSYDGVAQKFVRLSARIGVSSRCEIINGVCQTITHHDIAENLKLFSDQDPELPTVTDGGLATYVSPLEAVQLTDMTTSTQVGALIGMRAGSKEYEEAFRKIRRETAEILAKILGISVIALFAPNDMFIVEKK